ncbi:transposase [Thiovibrio frasassiensis]|uniref:Mu transposase C-terminal domain-containing protein n=1 Tax=Thiovibrio frasassiensis TaxID=2984131 RepID=A0A9X4MEV6_9BACT|nr:transposase [Thiovibrio frasassiensis]MDG4475407.1 Mu transposase C-terminal domain-containing protein [Thiovibrio frasassiensis]
MNALYSAKELLGLGLSTLPGTERSIARRAEQENWSFSWQTVQGGPRKMYRAHILPDYIRKAILAREEIDALVPVSPQPLPQDEAVSESQTQKALLKADLLRLYMQAMAIAPWGKKDQARADFLAAYNSGIAYPQIFAALGEINWKTIEGWKIRIKKSNGNTFQLADRRGSCRKGKSGLNETQTDILLRCALHPNKPRIAEAIRMAHSIMRTKGISNGHSEATYRRWLQDWTDRNYHIWVFNREGAKAWNDKCAFYIERDYNLINVGDVVVADGHTLNFEVINPWTGKPKRMTLICFLDMKSGIALGWEIMPTENTAAISSALRRAILRLGKIPQVVYLDNGRAFKSRFFQGTNFEEAGFAGLYERLDIKTIFAWPYHGQSKTVERFFGSFAELERWCPTYTGTSIEHKPPRMMRGERLHRKLHEKATGGHVLTMEEAHRAIAVWFDAHANRPQRGHLDGQTPMELFLEGRGPGVDKAALAYLMMSIEIKTIHRNGVTFQGQNYYAPALYGRRHPVVIRYDLQDTSTIYVFEQDGTYLCEANPVEKVHPAATCLGTEEDKAKLLQHIEFKKGQEKEASATARVFLEQEVLPEHQRQMATIGVLTDDRGQAKQLPAPVIHLDAEKLAREVAENARLQGEADEREFRETLLAMDNSDRFEKLLELEAQGVELAEEWLGFMAFFPKTGDYTNHEEYWESRRMAFTLMYRNQASK